MEKLKAVELWGSENTPYHMYALSICYFNDCRNEAYQQQCTGRLHTVVEGKRRNSAKREGGCGNFKLKEGTWSRDWKEIVSCVQL